MKSSTSVFHFNILIDVTQISYLLGHLDYDQNV